MYGQGSDCSRYLKSLSYSFRLFFKHQSFQGVTFYPIIYIMLSKHTISFLL